jgi:two-component system CheB/CheR fusion protein
MLEKRQALRVDLPSTAVWLKADGVRLTQVVTNLLHNAAKYTGQEGRLWLSAKTEGPDLVLRVRDTGIGIPPAMCKRVFDLFQQVQNGVEFSQGGLGIGLTLVRELVQLHGGTVEAHSAGVNLGSEFIVRLPVVDRSFDAERFVGRASASARAAGDSLRILVVDDSPGVTRSLEMILTDWKHVVHTCGDGFAALEAVQSFQPDFVLADLSMPRMSGYALAEELRRLPATKDAVLIAVSGFGQEADRERSQTAGFDRHLTKPVDLVELKELLMTHRKPN